ncbi:MAG: amino acid kinase family protein [Cuniculiplasma sp.]
MKTNVIKIGGSCLKSINSLRQLDRILKDWPNSIVVISAFDGITDRLYEQYENEERFSFVEGLFISFSQMLSVGITGWHEVYKELLALNDLNNDAVFKRTIENCSIEYYVSLGERLSASVTYIYLKRNNRVNFIPSHLLGIMVEGKDDQKYINISASMEKYEELRESLGSCTTITTGFYGIDSGGKISTLGRNTSDYSASAIAAITHSGDLTLFKDVDGIYPKDPKYFPLEKPYEFMDFDEALEIVCRGSEIVHENAIKLCKEYGITLRVLNFNNPERGTTISKFGQLVKYR